MLNLFAICWRKIAFGFTYAVSLSIRHPTMNVEKLKKTLPSFTPSTEVSAGDLKNYRSGQKRAASVSTWIAWLHSAENTFKELCK